MPDWKTTYSIPMSPDAAKAFYKFRGRSLDNLKRIYAVILSLAVGKFLEHIYANIRWLSGVHAPPTPQGISDWTAARDLSLQLVMFFIAITTVSVFFFQEDKLLDVAFGMDPNDEANMAGATTPRSVQVQRWIPQSFAMNYVITLLILVPFAFLTFSADAAVVRAVGMKDFFGAYLFLMVSGTFLASANVWVLRHHLPTEQAKVRSRLLTVNWRIINSTTVIVLVALYVLIAPPLGYDRPAPDGSWSKAPLLFGLVFLLVASARNWLDFRGTWPMLFLNEINEKKFGDGHDFSRKSLTYKLALWADAESELPDAPEGRRAKKHLERLHAFSRLWLAVAIAALGVLVSGWRP